MFARQGPVWIVVVIESKNNTSYFYGGNEGNEGNGGNGGNGV